MNKKELLHSLKEKGFSQRIIKTFEHVERKKFIPESLEKYSYEDTALPLVEGSTISQPSTIAFMLELLELKGSSKETILEIGSGSGYVLALLSQLTKGKIYGVEIIKSLVEQSKKILKNKNIKIYNKDGSQGLPEQAPFDRILISAAANEIPKHLYSQLKEKGILVAPVKNSIYQIKKENNHFKEKEFYCFVFVP